MKILRNVLVGMLVLLLVLGGLGVWVVRRAWPQTDGTASIRGISAPVQILRDTWGVPNIYAQNEHDLLLAQGYVHAQDRLWSMYYYVRAASGTLSEVVGSAALTSDQELRTFGLRRAAEQEWAAMGAEEKALLQAYCDGVNAFIDSHRNSLPLEFTVLGYTPESWSPIDSLTYANVISQSMVGNYRLEFLRARLIGEIGPEKTEDLLPPYDANKPLIIPDGVQGYQWMRGVDFAKLDKLDELLGNSAAIWGSNNWVVSGQRTVSGKPILASDAHMSLSMPSLWYMNGLFGGRFHTTGFTLPGTPGVLIGHNDRIAWAITNLGADVEDLYIEKLDDRTNPTKYEFQGQWKDIQVIHDTIGVKGADPVPLDIYITNHGPIINNAVADMTKAEPMALQWGGLGDSTLFTAILKLNAAQDWDQFREALRWWHMPGQNFVYADLDGNIGYQMTGKIPVRQPQHDGLVPVPGWSGEYEWKGFIPYDELPHSFNPPQGFIATANNKVIGDDYPYRINEEWDPGYRAARATQLLSANDHMDIAANQQIQGDTFSLPTAEIRPYMLEIKPQNDEETKAIALLEGWDQTFAADAVAPTLFETWYWFLFRDTLEDEMDLSLATDYLAGQYERHGRLHIMAMTRMLPDANNPWFDDKQTPDVVETRADIVRRSLGEALDWLKEHRGDDMSTWTWGSVHQVNYVNLLARSGNPLFTWLYYVPAIPARGENFTLNAGTFNFDAPFSMAHGTSNRQIIDLSDFDSMVGIHSTGQSGLVRHPNRTDMIPLWEDVEYVPVPFGREKIEGLAADTLTLIPESTP